MKSVVIVAFDMDGTLVDAQGGIHPQDVRVLTERRDVVWIPCSGRPLHAVRRAFDRHGVCLDQSLPFPMVLQNGSELYLPGERLLRQHTFPLDVQSRILEAGLRSPDVYLSMFHIGPVDEIWPTPFSRRMLERFDLLAAPYQPQHPPRRYSKFMAMAEDAARLADFAQSLPADGMALSFSLAQVLEMNPPGVDKRTGLQQVLAALQLPVDRLYVAGDGGNDLPLFELSSNSFAPSHALPQVLTQARHTIDRAEEGILSPILRLAAAGES